MASLAVKPYSFRKAAINNLGCNTNGYVTDLPKLLIKRDDVETFVNILLFQPDNKGKDVLIRFLAIEFFWLMYMMYQS